MMVRPTIWEIALMMGSYPFTNAVVATEEKSPAVIAARALLPVACSTMPFITVAICFTFKVSAMLASFISSGSHCRDDILHAFLSSARLA